MDFVPFERRQAHSSQTPLQPQPVFTYPLESNSISNTIVPDLQLEYSTDSQLGPTKLSLITGWYININNTIYVKLSALYNTHTNMDSAQENVMIIDGPQDPMSITDTMEQDSYALRLLRNFQNFNSIRISVVKQILLKFIKIVKFPNKLHGWSDGARALID